MQTPLRLVMVGIVTGSHVLIDDVPGVGKTTLVRMLASLLGLSFQRVQFTPDLMPTDITGTSVLDMRTNDFAFRPGPLFAQVVLADEINRATPKTQAALLEAMQEHQITVDGVSHPLPEPFFVLATQNPIELEGTFPLPEAQLDRFLLRVRLGYPDEEQEERILTTTPAQRRLPTDAARGRARDPRPAGPGRRRRARASRPPLHRVARARHARSPGALRGREPARRRADGRRRAGVGAARRPRLRPARRREAARRAGARRTGWCRPPTRGSATGPPTRSCARCSAPCRSRRSSGRADTDTPQRRRVAIGVAVLAALLATAWGRTSALLWAAGGHRDRRRRRVVGVHGVAARDGRRVVRAGPRVHRRADVPGDPRGERQAARPADRAHLRPPAGGARPGRPTPSRRRSTDTVCGRR